jgi:membrane protein implicated in regulation of membrane protease activity
MSLWVSWVLLGILFLIVETFFLSGDFLAIGLGAIITGLVVKFINFGYMKSLLGSSILFLVVSTLLWFVIKWFYSKFVKKTPNIPVHTNERIVGQVLIVQVVNGEKVVFFEGIYYPIVNADEVDV